MRPCLRRRALGTSVLALSLAAIGCAPQGARTFSVVLEEPPKLQCTPTLSDVSVDFEGLFYLLNELPDSWQKQYEAGQLRPAGGELHTFSSSSGREVSGWFEKFMQSPYYQWNGVVFRGAPNDGFIDLTSLVSHDTGDDRPIEQGGCGVLVDSVSTLTATIDGGSIEGRVRRVDFLYFASTQSLCAARIACARNIALSGAEE